MPRLHLTLKQVENNWAALGQAERLGLRPTVTLDISFGVGKLINADGPDGTASQCLKDFLKSARQWIERKGSRTACIWALENRYTEVGQYTEIGRGTGIHAHVLMHVPSSLTERFHQLKRGWAQAAGLTPAPGLFGPKGEKRPPLRTLEQAKGKLAYMCKDLHPKHLAIFEPFINPRTGKPYLHNSGGGKPSNAPIYGKKTGVSRNIDVTARKDFHYQRQREALAA